LTPFAGAGLTYRACGLLFFFSSAVALLPLLAASMRELHAHNSVAPAQDSNDSARGMALAFSCGIIPLLFAFLNTRIHARYWHAAILFLASYGFLRSNYWPYVLRALLIGQDKLISG
jgi:hypothetical protein